MREQKQILQIENLGRDELQKRITDMNAFLLEQPTSITEYDDTACPALIEKVTVFEDRFTVNSSPA